VRLRLVLLLLLAVAAPVVVGVVDSAQAGKPTAAAPRIPALPAAARLGPACPIPARYRSAFDQASAASGLPLPMLVAVAQVESRFKASAVSTAGARGLLQVLPSTARSLRLSADAPESNVLAGARYLRTLLDRFHSTDLALAAYNAGPTAVTKAGGAPTSETITYVANVTQGWRALNGCR
jgi:peptidoglycan DL-endopeptidase CwlO